MREITVKVYDFNELNESVQKRVLDNFRNHASINDAESVNVDYEYSLEKIMEVFGIVVIVNNDYTFNWKFNSEIDFHKPLLRWLNQSIFPLLNKGRYYSSNFRFKNGRYEYTYRYSKVLFDNYNCCLTGTYTDNAVDKMLNNAYKYVKDNYTTSQFIDKMLHMFMEYWKEDVDECYTDEYIKEQIDSEGLEFFYDGKIYGE